MGFVKKAVTSIAKVAVPVLGVAAMVFPPLAPIAGAAKLAQGFVQNMDKAFKNFPKGLVGAALGVAGNFLPKPGDQISKFLADPGSKLAGVIPKGALGLLPKGVQAKVPGTLNRLLDGVLPKAPTPFPDFMKDATKIGIKIGANNPRLPGLPTIGGLPRLPKLPKLPSPVEAPPLPRPPAVPPLPPPK